VEKVFSLTKIDRWFLRQIEEIVKESHPESSPGHGGTCLAKLQEKLG
jgi:hypothetical protein